MHFSTYYTLEQVEKKSIHTAVSSQPYQKEFHILKNSRFVLEINTCWYFTKVLKVYYFRNIEVLLYMPKQNINLYARDIFCAKF